MAPEPSWRSPVCGSIWKSKKDRQQPWRPPQTPPSLAEDVGGGGRGLAVLAYLAVQGTSPREWGALQTAERKSGVGFRVRALHLCVRVPTLLPPPARASRHPASSSHGPSLFPAGQLASPGAGGPACHRVTQARWCLSACAATVPRRGAASRVSVCVRSGTQRLSRSCRPVSPRGSTPHSEPSAQHPPVSPDFPRGRPLCVH